MNLKPLDDQNLASAMAKFAEAVERGTAIISIPSGYIEMRRGLAFYRALDGTCWQAQIVCIDEDSERATLDVNVPGVEEPVRLTRIPIR